MKKTLVTLFCLSPIWIYAQDHKGTPLVKKGKEIFVCSQPTEKYTEVFRVSSTDLGNFMKQVGGEEKHSLLDNLDRLVNNADRKAKKKELFYDAIITDDATTGICIKFQ